MKRGRKVAIPHSSRIQHTVIRHSHRVLTSKRSSISKRTTPLTRLTRTIRTTRTTRPARLDRSKRQSVLRSEKAWRDWGEQVGREDAAHYNLANEGYQKKALNGHWLTRIKEKGLSREAWSHYWQAVKGYLEGFGHVSGIATYDWMLLPTGRTVAAVISVMNEEATVMNILNELHRLPLDEIIVIVNGSSDTTFQKVREGSQALIVHYPEPLGYDVGRVIGSKLTSSDIIIYVDGDVPVIAEQLLPFISAIDQGTDVALNHITPFLDFFSEWDGVSVMKQFMNRAMGRPDLAANSLTAVPHALSRKALETIGVEHLMVPPQFQMLAIAKGLVVSAPWSVDVISTNRVNKRNAGIRNSVSDMIIGDHIEALHAAQELGGERLAFPDLIRNRSYLA